MINKVLTASVGAIIVSGLSVGVTACTAGHKTSGAGLRGAAIFPGSGQWMGDVGRASANEAAGNTVGQYMGKKDRLNMQRAIVSGHNSTWTNARGNITYNVRPIKTYKSRGRYCREYRTTVTIGDKKKHAVGRACRMSGGAWKVVR